MARTRQDLGAPTPDGSATTTTAPGKRTLTSGLLARASASSGEPLRGDVQARFESSLGRDLSAVRVHTGADSADAAGAAGARAFAIGNDVHFGAGRYQPDDPFGMHLLAHEVAHTQQQAGGAAHPQYALEVSQPGDAWEAEADRAADAMVHGRPAAVSAAGPAIQRAPEDIYDEPAPASTRDPAQLDAVRVAKLKSDLETERDDSRNVVFATADAIDAIDERLKTATGDDKAQLEGKKKELSKTHGDAEKRLDQAVADLQLWDNRPDVTAAQRNDMLARRGVTVAMPGWTTDSSSTTIDDKGVTRATSSTATWQDGGGGSNTATSSTSTNVGLTGASRTTSTKDSRIAGDTTTTSGQSSTSAVDWSKGSVSTSNTSSTSTKGPNGSSGTTTTTGVTVGADGISGNHAVTTEKDGNKSTASASGGITRGDGQVGVTATRGVSKENADGSSSSASSTTTGGVIASKDGVGGYGSQELAGSKKSAGGLEVKGSVKAQGRAVVNITKVPDSDPVKYQIVLTVSLGASASASLGAEKSGVSGSIGGDVSGQVVASFGQTLDEDATKSYLASLDGASAGSPGSWPETQLIAKGINEGWPAARDYWQRVSKSGQAIGDLKDGQSVSVDATGSAGVKGDLGVKNDGGASFSVSGGYEVHGEVKFAASRKGKDTIVSILIVDGSTLSGGGSAGFGAASFSASGSHSTSAGKGYTFTVSDDNPGAGGLRSTLQGIRTVAALDTFAGAHPELIGVRTTTDGTADKVTAGVKLGPGGVELNTGGSYDHTRSEHLDDKGNVIATDDAYNGDTSVGGKATLGPLSLGSNKDEHANVNVHQTLQKDGTWKQEMSADVGTTDSSSAPSLDKTLQGAEDTLKHDPAALVTGKDPIIKNQDKVAVAGVFLSDADFNNIIGMAERDPHRWVNCGIKDPDGWRKFGNEIRAANGDKRKVAEAMARYFGDGANCQHQESLDELLGIQHGGGGDRYELPDGLGDLKPTYAKLVVGNPMGDIEQLVASGDLAKAASTADSLATECEMLASKLGNAQAAFDNVDIHSEMYGRALRRGAELRKRARELQAQASGGKVDPAQLDKAAAIDEWNSLYERCKNDAAEEEKVFEIIGKNYDGLMGNHDEPENVKYVNQLRELAKRWRTDYARMVQLGDAYGFSDAANNWKNLKPDEVRIDLAYRGHNPMSDEAKDAQMKADQDAMTSSDPGQSDQAGKTLMMTSGMTNIGGSTFYREKTDEEMAPEDAALRARIQNEYPSCEAKIAEYRGKASQAMGKCNSLPNKDALSNAVKAAYSEGFRLNGEADANWRAAQAAAKSQGKSKEFRRFFDYYHAAWVSWSDAADAFKKGDELV